MPSSGQTLTAGVINSSHSPVTQSCGKTGGAWTSKGIWSETGSVDIYWEYWYDKNAWTNGSNFWIWVDKLQNGTWTQVDNREHINNKGWKAVSFTTSRGAGMYRVRMDQERASMGHDAWCSITMTPKAAVAGRPIIYLDDFYTSGSRLTGTQLSTGLDYNRVTTS